jgi:hypothetical protein
MAFGRVTMSDISAVSAALSQEMASTAAAVQALKLSRQQDQQVLDVVTRMVQSMAQAQEAGKGRLIDLAG